MGKKRREVVVDVRWTPEAKAIIRKIEQATETLKLLSKLKLPIKVTTSRGRRRRDVRLAEGG